LAKRLTRINIFLIFKYIKKLSDMKNKNTPTPPPRSAFKTEAAYKAAMREYNEMKNK
jgi:hypothetical protein